MADEYWVDIIHRRPKRRGDVLGADDYVIIPQGRLGDRSFQAVGDRQFAAVGKKYRLAAEVETVGGPHHRSHSKRYWQQPLFYTVDYGDVPVNVSYEDNDIPDDVSGPFGIPDSVFKQVTKKLPPAQRKQVDAALHKQGQGGGFGNDMIHAMNSVVSVAGKSLDLAKQGLESIPVIGDPIQKVLALDPAKALGGIIASVNSGERLDKAFLEAGKRELQAIKEVAPYVQKVVSFVPGVGTGVAAALAAGTALAEGRTISDAVLQGLAGAVPGGAIGKTAFSSALAIVHGDKLSNVALDAVKSQLPPAVQQAVSTAVAAAGGKNVREAVLNAIRNNLPESAKHALDIGVAVAAGKNAQSAVANALVNDSNLSRLASLAVPSQLQRLIPSGSAARGFKIASGILRHKGVTPVHLAAARSRLTIHEQIGFDHAIKSINNMTKPNFTSLVRGGLVSRGNWKKVTANTKGAVAGRLVSGRTITHGHFVRV